MKILFKKLLSRELMALLLLCICCGARADTQLASVRIAFTSKTISPANIDMLIPEYLGYYRAEGLTVEPLAIGSYGAALAAIDAKRIEFASLVPDYQLALVAKGTKLPVINFFEATYPFKYAVAVKPGSAIKSFADLKGKTIGIPTADQKQNAYSLFKVAGLDPDKDVTWLIAGEGIPSGVALQRGNIDALFAYDTIFGTIEGGGIKLTYLPQPAHLPQISGSFLSATPDYLSTQRKQAVGVGRAIAKAHVFIQDNPEAAAYIFTQMFPEASPKGKTAQEQVNAILVPVAKRAPLYSSLNKSITKWGYIESKDWSNSAELQDLSLSDFSKFYTNDLIDEINAFDPESIKTEARNFKLPYK